MDWANEGNILNSIYKWLLLQMELYELTDFEPIENQPIDFEPIGFQSVQNLSIYI
jgi:hypothetical protein